MHQWIIINFWISINKILLKMMFKHSDFEKESLGTSDPCSGTCSQIFGYLPVFASA